MAQYPREQFTGKNTFKLFITEEIIQKAKKALEKVFKTPLVIAC
ncbi:MAG: hypothetical protein Ct9H300mP5_1520 [Candidatus Pelagibacterales bacterium]|nr:MAG: hypothetical protein Ct9H300mP5_1520 [Pelagibacterales bacterium]